MVRNGGKLLALQAARIITQKRILYIKWVGEDILVAAIKGNNSVYFVTLNIRTGRATCTCPGYYFKGYCKHILALKTYISRVYISESQTKPPSSLRSA